MVSELDYKIFRQLRLIILKILVCNKINNTNENYTINITSNVYVTTIGTHFTN
jgi:hypothetical protein